MAVKDNLLAVNLANGISVRAVTPQGKQFLTHTQIEALARASGKLTVSSALAQPSPTKSNQVRKVPISTYSVDEVAAMLATRSAAPDGLDSPIDGDITRNRNFLKESISSSPSLAWIGFLPDNPHSLRQTAASLAIKEGAGI